MRETRWASMQRLCAHYDVGRSTIQRKVHNGTLPPPVKFGPKTDRFDLIEIADIDNLHRAGGSDDDAKQRVLELIAARAQPRERAA